MQFSKGISPYKSAIFRNVTKKIKNKIEQCHKVLGGDLVLTHSYSKRWQVARIRLCGRGAVCDALAE